MAPLKVALLVLVAIAFVGARAVVQANNDLYNRWLGTSLGKRAENRQIVAARLIAVVMALAIVVM